MNCDHRKIKQTERSESQITIDPLSRDSLRIESKQNDVMRHGNEKKFESLTCSFVSTSGLFFFKISLTMKLISLLI